MFIRCCLILHNLIIRVEANSFDTGFREQLYRAGRDAEQEGARGDLEDGAEDDEDDDDSDDEDGVGRARRRLDRRGGYKFRRSIMNRLFDSPTSGAVRRT